MHPYFSESLAAERQRDLLASAERHRLAAAVAPPAALRLRLGRRLVGLGVRISGNPRPIGHPQMRP